MCVVFLHPTVGKGLPYIRFIDHSQALPSHS